jgi:hypothetical protein
MSDVASLKVLKDNRDALLLAEVIGWLHDYRKCSDEYLRTLASQPSGQGLPRKELGNRFGALENVSISITLIGNSRSLLNLLDDRTWNQDTLGQFLQRCHNTSHFDKQEPGDGRQNYPGTKISSPFGFEEDVPQNLTDRLWGLPWNDLPQTSQKRRKIIEAVSGLFSQIVADTRRPINEVDLWSWGSLVAALYKAALAGVLLTGRPCSPNDLRWRLLSVRVDGLGYLSNAVRIPDLLARQQLLTDGLDKVRDLLEVEYPFGGEIYRDVNGALYIVPDIPSLLDLTSSDGKCLKELIAQSFGDGTIENNPSLQIDGEIAPKIGLEQQAWWGQDPEWAEKTDPKRKSPKFGQPLNDELPNINYFLAGKIISGSDPNKIATYWQNLPTEDKWEVCPVCRLRPMREGAEACEICDKRRKSRVEWWEKNPHRTIWMDELADHNDRVALIVGRFRLDDWLSGELVQTMLVRADPASNTFTPKNPSPARLRRVWETCQRFWTETVVDVILQNHPYSRGHALRCARVAVVPADVGGWQEGVPYDGTINGKAVSLFWLESKRHFITISNLQLGVRQAIDGVGLVKEWHGHECMVSLPNKPSQMREFQIRAVTSLGSEPPGTYAPYLTLLTSPDQFLALVPAADALEVADKIKSEYERQMGKVQNRLPLFLGIVLFQRKMPLLAVMDAARRMLEAPLKEESWKVECCRPDAQGHEQYLCLSQGEHRLIMKVPIKMGHNTTDDIWYPYVFVEHFADGTPDNRQYRFQHNGRWLVYVRDLKEEDVVKVTPSCFTYLWLEHTAKRFAFDPARDFLLLDELPRLVAMWNALKGSGITITALHNVRSLLEAKASAWGATGGEFRHLVETTLKEAGLYARKDKDGTPLADVVTPKDVLCGRFSRCLELYLHILKQKIKED